jgi:CDP-paratose 2-epimerase
MKFLITGGCGFIGSNLAAEVLNRGEELIVFDNLFRYGSSKNLNWLRTKGEFKHFHYDIRNYNDVETVIQSEKPDVIFHLAALIAIPFSYHSPDSYIDTNVKGTLNILQAARDSSHPCRVFGESRQPQKNDGVDDAVRRVGERHCQRYGRIATGLPEHPPTGRCGPVIWRHV